MLDRFRDEFWASASGFHDSDLAKLTLSAVDKTLALHIIAIVDERPRKVLFIFRNVHDFSFFPEEFSEVYRDYSMPPSGLVGSWELEQEGRWIRVVITGAYGWICKFLTDDFNRSID